MSAVLQLVEVALAATRAYGRADLTGRLRRTRERLADPAVRVLVAGEFKQGKSSLVNALINAPVCPVDADVATAVPTVVRHAEAPGAVLVRQTEEGETVERIRVALEALPEVIKETRPGADPQRNHVEVGIPRELLAQGLTLVDTPGVGGLGSVHGASMMAALPGADAVLFVSDASQEYTATELEFLLQARNVCPTVACVLAKIDFYPEWRRIAELDRRHLAAAGVDAGLLPVSATLRLHAARTEDQALNAESGFPRLITHLRDEVLARAEELDRCSAVHDVLAVADQLTATMSAELAILRDPGRAQDLVAELERAERRADDLRQRSARWQQTLGDGITDLTADVDYDLRDRMRQIVRDAEKELDEVDPATVADQFATWLHQRLSAAATANFLWAGQRARWLAGRVAEHFAEDGRAILPELPGDARISLDDTLFELPRSERFGLGEKLMLGMRGGYGGALMFGMLGTLAGMALLNPISIAAGVLLGGKTVRDERKRLRLRRQMDAKNAVRRHVDDVIFQVGKESRDMLRRVQRELRDHFTSRAEELQRSLTESLSAARDAFRREESDRKQRIQDLQAELERVAKLAESARRLAEGEVTPG
ncbi:isoniazid-induced protein IniA [Longimycelium tulufanense]|uniref:Isoniazid-induced protein IniA n=1 Tax=Longimycelium tulufanense TaxID=907463 RepID=A0A8J3C7A1_9PSEU|nr:dynamin family protein [Longimycelium tulufanense]GGM33910.1 isoniazid-induced protein IniA [Longimycelium tulufanense]